MKGSSKVIMGATMAIVIILAIVLGLILVLLAELYCSILLRRRKLKARKPDSIPENPSTPQQPQEQLVPSPLSSFYSQGVLDAPRSFLFPKLPSRREKRVEFDDIEKPKHGKLHQFLRVQSPQLLGLASSSSPSPNLIPVLKPHPHFDENPEIEVEGGCVVNIDESCNSSGKGNNFMYISNPIYDNEVARPSHVATPFETPDSSPSYLDRSGSSGGEEEKENEKEASSSPSSLPLSPMKELPAKAASISLRDARSLGTSCSESNSRIGPSSSSSDSPRTSPSW